jgi:sialate O-acetylesterase
MISTHNSTRIASLFLSLALGMASSSLAEVQVSKIFGDHMILQQNQPVRVWGQAAPGATVVVVLEGSSASVKTGGDGKWRAELPALKADGKAHTMQIVAGEKTIKFEDILIGEVWICSGQSNMEWQTQGSMNAKEEVAAADYPQIRLFDVPGHVAGPEPQDDPRGTWKICTPQSVPGFSAVGYYFGRELYQNIKVPIGLVGTNWGGTRIEPWTPPLGFRAVSELKDYTDNLDSLDPATPAGKANYQKHLDQVDTWMTAARAGLAAGKRSGNPPTMGLKPKGGATEIYNGMVHALTPLSVRGAIWYQGESNAGDGLRYEYMKEALVKGWRTVFENEELAFYWVQLADFQQPSDNPAGGGWGPVREGQRRALRLPHTGMAVTIDVGDARDIHPRNKQDVGKRLARWALAKNYGQDIVCSGPLYKGMKREGDKIRILFDHVGSGLMAGKKIGLEPTKETAGAELQRFAVQDAEGNWHWAKARIDGETVLVWNDDVKAPAQVRFGYESNPAGINLYNREGLPASPFTTD